MSEFPRSAGCKCLRLVRIETYESNRLLFLSPHCIEQCLSENIALLFVSALFADDGDRFSHGIPPFLFFLGAEDAVSSQILQCSQAGSPLEFDARAFF